MGITSIEQKFWSWFTSLPVYVREHLSWLFYLHTSQDVNDYSMSKKEALSRFDQYCQSWDFESRRIARLLIIRAMFDYFFIRPEIALACTDNSKIPDLNQKQWKKYAREWGKIRQTISTGKLLRAESGYDNEMGIS